MSSQNKLIAFYLPQYHPFQENDAWWGRGFTEWTNVTKALPNFVGHVQPHLPADLGFYDLRLRESRQAQADLARAAGIYGFCYYYYWFGGKRLLERPLDAMLADGAPDMPFCFCWANENWTRRWDGAEHQVLMAQQHSPEDDLAFIRSLFPFFRDSRYIRVEGRLLLLIYRFSLFPCPRETVARWREEALREGFGELHIAAVQSFDIQDPREFGCDSAVEFPPHGMRWTPAADTVQMSNPNFRGNICDYLDMVRGALEKPAVPYRRYRGVMPGFDNTARRQDTGDIFINASPRAYQLWLEGVLRAEAEIRSGGGETLVFINAWNEWGEGNHLEPDRHHGHAYLDATRNALASVASNPAPRAVELAINQLAHQARSARAHAAAAMRDDARAELETVLSSTSWRITAPLRVVGSGVRRLGQAKRVACAMRQRHGGWGQAVRRAIEVVRQQRLYSPASLLATVDIAAQRSVTGVVGRAENAYQNWFARQLQWRLSFCSGEVGALLAHDAAPTISIVMPVYNSNIDWLREAIDSVLAQHYAKWQLCIADDASTDARVRRILEQYCEADARIQVVFRPSNGHIVEASNSALGLVRGDFVAFLDHDDVLTPDSLFWMARAALADPRAALIYSDEDRLGEDGQLSRPYCKPDWNPELLRAQNYLCHLTMARTSLVRELGGFFKGTDGAQDHDLFLRLGERLDDASIVHLPLVLYHWREHPASTSSGSDAKPYANDAARRAVTAHLNRLGIAATVEPAPEAPCWLRVRYPLPATLPRISVIIPTRNQHALLRQCIDSLAVTGYPDYEILVVNNGSDDPDSLAYLREIGGRSNIRVLDDFRPFSFAGLNNDAVKHARGDLLLFLNNDIQGIGPDWLNELVSHVLCPGVGVVGARLWFPNHTLQHGGVVLGIFGVASHAHYGLGRGDPGYFGRAILAQNFSAVTGACLLVRRQLFNDLGGFDENLAISLNDVDFCLRAGEKGFRTVWTPYAELYHHESATRGQDDTPAKKAQTAREFKYFSQRWMRLMMTDPAYNINLTLEHCDFSLTSDPRYSEWLAR